MSIEPKKFCTCETLGDVKDGKCVRCGREVEIRTSGFPTPTELETVRIARIGASHETESLLAIIDRFGEPRR